MKEIFDIQDFYLDCLQYQNLAATFFLINGFQLKGRLRHYDDNVLIVESNGKQQMIFKHALSTIMPNHELNFPAEY